MTIALRLAAAALAVAAVATSAAHAGGSAYTVKSTLDGRKVLPLRTRWTAQTSIPPSRLKEVDFLIDGKVRWIEHHSPYNFGSDDEHGHLGFLITTWLTPGRHAFTARAVDNTGVKAEDTVVARVLPAPAPPAELAGKTWTRLVSGTVGGPPSGRWKLIFDRVGAWHLDPLGSGVGNQYDIAGDVIHVYAPIQMAPLINDHTTTSRYGAHNVGGLDCREDGPFGSYRWSVSGDELTLAAIHESCPSRRDIWEGTWTLTK